MATENADIQMHEKEKMKSEAQIGENSSAVQGDSQPPEKLPKAVGFGCVTNVIPAFQCPICYDPTETSGEHQMSCLPCGHIFGRSCVKVWLDKEKKCPNCCKRTYSKWIRKLWGDYVVPPEKHAECERMNNRINSLSETIEDQNKRISGYEEIMEAVRTELAELGSLQVSP